MWLKVGKYLFLVSGWITALFIGALDLPQKIHSFFENFPAAKNDVATWWNLNSEFSGAWTNEGDVTAVPATSIALSMRIYDGKIDGEIWSDGLKDTVHPVILLGGVLRKDELQAYAFDLIDGKQTVYATFSIRKKEDRLILKTVAQPIKFFPDQAELFASPDALKDKPLTNFDLLQKSLKSIKKN